MTDHTFFQVDEQCFRLDTQDGVTGMIPATKRNAALVAYYLRLDDPSRERVMEMMNRNLRLHVEREFVRTVQNMAEEEAQFRDVPRRARCSIV